MTAPTESTNNATKLGSYITGLALMVFMANTVP